MTKTIIDQYKTSAEECAHFVFESQWVQDDYTVHIESDHDPRDHILYNAAVILGKTEEFENDINEYLQIESD